MIGTAVISSSILLILFLSLHTSLAKAYVTDSLTHFEKVLKRSSVDQRVEQEIRIRAPFDCGLGICPDDPVGKPIAILRIETDIFPTGSCGEIPLIDPDCPNNTDMNFGVTVGQNEYKIKGSPDWIVLQAPIDVDAGANKYKVSFTGPNRINWQLAVDESDTHYWGYRADKSTSVCEGIISKGTTVECHLKIYYSSYSTS
jgi:hypothetical protein